MNENIDIVPPPPLPPSINSSSITPTQDSNRNALLNSIKDFNKGNLKKAKTRDASSPITSNIKKIIYFYSINLVDRSSPSTPLNQSPAGNKPSVGGGYFFEKIYIIIFIILKIWFISDVKCKWFRIA